MSNVSAKNLSLTFDDGLDPGKNSQARLVNDQLLQELRDNHLQAMVFPTVSLIGGKAGLDIIKTGSDAGHYVGNHSATRQGLSAQNISLDFFIADVLKADAIFRTLCGWLPLLRFPYLQEGDTPEKRDGFRQWMRIHGYRPASVSIETVIGNTTCGFLNCLSQIRRKKSMT
jgi:peptidoglycan-N-acetylglucosamine deacetylase